MKTICLHNTSNKTYKNSDVCYNNNEVVIIIKNEWKEFSRTALEIFRISSICRNSVTYSTKLNQKHVNFMKIR
jgi:hypothetical protein